MPRKYVSIKTYKNHEPEKIKGAINYKLTEGKSLRDAANKYDIHYSVLCGHLKKGENIKKEGDRQFCRKTKKNYLLKTSDMWRLGLPYWPLNFKAVSEGLSC